MENPRGGRKKVRSSGRGPRNPSQITQGEQPVREISPPSRTGQGAVPESPRGRSHAGLDPEQGIKQWLQYAKGADHAGVTGQRAFRSDLELVNAMEEEAKSLFLFARDIGLDFSETLPLRVDRATPFKEGNEHRVFMATVGNIARVVKVTHPGKYGETSIRPISTWNVGPF